MGSDSAPINVQYLIDSFDNYFESARATEVEVLESDSPFFGALRGYHQFFVEHVFTEENAMSPFQSLLAMHGIMIYLSSIRIAISGHEAATFPLLRSALEACCYAYLMGDSSELHRIWLRRNESEEDRQACRNAFTSAVKNAANKLRNEDWVAESTAEWINQAYDSAIDFGAHPNPMAIFPYVTLDENRPDNFVGVSLAGLHSAQSFETSRSLVACLDYGLLMAVVLVCVLKEKSDAAINAIDQLNDLNEQLTKEHLQSANLEKS